MKKLLCWLFKNEWEEFIAERREDDFWHKTIIEKNMVAEKYLKQLGYELTYNNPIHEIKEGESPMPFENYGWKLIKK